MRYVASRFDVDETLQRALSYLSSFVVSQKLDPSQSLSSPPTSPFSHSPQLSSILPSASLSSPRLQPCEREGISPFYLLFGLAAALRHMGNHDGGSETKENDALSSEDAQYGKERKVPASENGEMNLAMDGMISAAQIPSPAPSSSPSHSPLSFFEEEDFSREDVVPIISHFPSMGATSTAAARDVGAGALSLRLFASPIFAFLRRHFGSSDSFRSSFSSDSLAFSHADAVTSYDSNTPPSQQLWMTSADRRYSVLSLSAFEFAHFRKHLKVLILNFFLFSLLFRLLFCHEGTNCSSHVFSFLSMYSSISRTLFVKKTPYSFGFVEFSPLKKQTSDLLAPISQAHLLLSRISL
jgi:hypothetical protein